MTPLLLIQAVFVFLLFGSSVQAREIPTRTIVDILSANPEFSTLLELLQRHSLIPEINQAFNSTFLAPVNTAFVGIDENLITRDMLLYHFLSEDVVLPEDLSKTHKFYVSTYLNQSTDNPTPVYVYIEGNEVNHGKSLIVEANLLASRNRGTVHAISDLLTIPPPVCRLLLETNELSFYSKLMNLDRICEVSRKQKYLTLFAPNDIAFANLSTVEKLYLTSQHGGHDRSQVIARQRSNQILRPDGLPTKLILADGSEVNLSKDLVIDSHIEPESTWILAQDGVVHTYPSFIGDFPVEFTPEKYILALNGETFLHEVWLHGHGALVNGKFKANQTILIPASKDAFEEDALSKVNLPADQTRWDSSIYDDVLYQFSSESIQLGSSSEGSLTLFDSKLPLSSKKHFQKIKYYQRAGGNPLLNWKSVQPEPYVIGNTTIYIMDGKLPLPPPLAMAVGPLFSSSYSLEFLDELELLTLPSDDSWTVLLPTRDAWEDQFLLKKFFDKNPEKLKALFKYYLLREPIYSDTTQANYTTTLLDGTEVSITVDPRPDEPGKFTLWLDGEIEASTVISDILFDNGVVHCISKINLPQALEIDSRGLIDSDNRSAFSSLLATFNMSYILDGVDLDGSPMHYTLLVPNITALTEANFTASNPATAELLKLHILQGEQGDRLFAGEGARTLSNHDLVFKLLTDSSPPIYSVGPVSAEGKRTYVSSWARTNGHNGTENEVLLLGSFISPEWLKQPFIPPQWRVRPRTLVLTGILLGLMIMCVALVAGVFVFTEDASSSETDDASQPLLRPATRSASSENEVLEETV